MKIKSLKISLFLFALLSIVVSCKDDDEVVTSFVEIDRTEQQIEDNDMILNYLSTHYYNSGFFETASSYNYSDIDISELSRDPDGNLVEVPPGHTLLLDAVVTRTTTFEEAEYEYYILNINQGGGESPEFTDALRVRYEGRSINEEEGGFEAVFDSSSVPVEFNLQANFINMTGVIRAWQLVMPEFNTALDFDINSEGILEYTNPGLGVMFVPSGLAYFSQSTTGSSFDNLIFKFELLQHETIDHDDDGIPSYIEDLNQDLDVTTDDTDDNGFFNFIDSDDDGDGVLTIDELIPGTRLVGEPFVANEYEVSRSEIEGVMTIKTVTIADSNGDGTADYLDDTIQINYNVEDNN